MARRTTTKTKPVEVEPEELDDEIEDLDEDEVEEEEPEPAPVKKRGRPTKKAAVVVEDDDDIEDEDEDAQDDDEEEKPAKAKRTPPKRPTIEFGTAWLAGFVNEKLDTNHTPYSLRNLVRKMVKEGAFDRAVGEDRSRYEFTGPKDKAALAIVKYVEAAGKEVKSNRSDNLAKARAARKANLEAKKKAVEVDDDDEIEELDD